ncbi:helix-turn-helix domain-containing protein [Nocardioides terrisoli]|uniref:helix-turn-helix domain-containing protein n=1 Tax=Nocardioides terrisoli TaxID=3388267 RepID=UPI00287B968E|nr:helix-turn-helix domain-containing protein [Nocardioides marmorisolisilvae]
MTSNPDAPRQGRRFLQLADVAEVLNISGSQAYALVRRGDIRAVKIGGRGQWRVEATELEAYIERLYTESERFVVEHPFADEVDADL